MFSSPYSLSESVVIDRSVATVFQSLVDFKTWDTWSPWMLQDPEAASAYTGKGNEKGDIMSWDSDLIGTGEIEHVQIEENKSITQELRFTKPFKLVSEVHFVVEKLSEEQTKVVWSMNGKWPWFLWFMKKQMVAMIGEDYKRGLAMLKSLIETGKIDSKITFNGIKDIPETRYIGIKKTESIPEMQKNMGSLFDIIWKESEKQGLDLSTSKFFAIYNDMNFVTQMCTYTVAISLNETDQPTAADEMFIDIVPAHQAYTVHHLGKYDFLGNPWTAAMNYIFCTKGINLNKKISPWEEYLTDPDQTKPEENEVLIGVPLK